MGTNPHDFLYEMLRTPSPSGREDELQEKWLEYVKSSADELRTDGAGNAYAILQPEAPFRVLLAGHSDEIGFMIKHIDESGFLRVEPLGGISPLPALGMRVTVLGTNGTITGIFGTNAEHHGGANEKMTTDDLYIDCGVTTKAEIERYIQIGDPAVYDIEPQLLLNESLSGRGLDNRTGSYIVAEVIRRLKDETLSVGVYGVSTVNEETNMGGAFFAGAMTKPTIAIALDVTFATDFPSASPQKNGDVRLQKGPVLAKGAPINRKVNELLERAAKDEGISLQYELTPKTTGTDADQLRLTGSGVPVAVLSLPLRYMHAPQEMIALQDIEQEITLLTRFILNLTGKEDIKPVHVPN
ncbi:M20/M25/M40 family metallo-hydrolase [Geomicrobium sp. JCM 19039]|uniref:M20/M25/M40 family metallo-hydrolase n=1 Tax=Geomicrobium sp. JCM 19039 TaxID=1460636 RepID=UPI00045F1326|nr:M20/M25/M40 family metallo-hydrolase [Geomicrobium sp. JCM 19039]GAK11583.1 endoglucanase [Geomicrobium sp. JCM 19039]